MNILLSTKMKMSIVLILFVSTVNCLKIEGKAKPVFHDDLSSELAFDICTHGGVDKPEYVQIVNKTENSSVTYGLNNDGMEQYLGGKDIGFGIYPTNVSGVVSIHAWHGGNDGKMVSMLVDLKNNTILSTEIHTDLTKVMCYGEGDDHRITKRDVQRRIESILAALVRKVCSYVLDYSIMASMCEGIVSQRIACLRISVPLEVVIPVPGDSFVWYLFCKSALKVLCAGTVGELDPTTIPVCDWMGDYLQDIID